MRNVALPPLIALVAACGPSKDLPEPFEPPTPPADTPIVDETAEPDPVETATSDTPETDTPEPPPPACPTPTAVGLATACDWSVNEASAPPPTSAGGTILLSTRATGSQPVGGYNGPGTGNRAILGFSHYDARPLADMATFTIEATKINGSDLTGPELGLVVDLACDGTSFSYINVAFANLGTPTTTPSGASRWLLLRSAAKFTAVGGLFRPGSTELQILPDADFGAAQGAPGTLDDVSLYYPNACLKNADIGATELPNATATSAVLLTLGRANNLIRNTWRLSSFEVGDDVHGPP
jgi:hypothetical protein